MLCTNFDVGVKSARALGPTYHEGRPIPIIPGMHPHTFSYIIMSTPTDLSCILSHILKEI